MTEPFVRPDVAALLEIANRPGSKRAVDVGLPEARRMMHASRSLFERSQKIGRFGQKAVVRKGYIESLPGQLAGWTAMRDVYPVANQTFREWWSERS